MIGPVLSQEMLLGGRRSREHLLRWLYLAWLLLQFGALTLVFLLNIGVFRRRWADALDFSVFASDYLLIYLRQHFLVILLATPALVAGAITDEKWRGTLQYLLTADLRPWEILVGKLVGRGFQVVVLSLIGLPLLCFIGVFGGLELQLLLALALCTVLAVFAIAAASLLAAVWARHTRDAVISLYTIGGLTYLVLWGLRDALDPFAAAGTSAPPSGLAQTLAGWLTYLLNVCNPLYVLEPAWQGDSGRLTHRVVSAALVWGSFGLVCVALGSWRLQPAYLRQLENTGKKKKAHWWRVERVAVSGDPIRWKERHVEGIAPWSFLRQWPRWLGLLLVFLATLLSLGTVLAAHMPPGENWGTLSHRLFNLDWVGVWNVIAALDPAAGAFFYQGLVVMLIASLVVAVRCSGAVSGEREKQTWEALLLAPLETRQLIRSKLWGIIGATYPYLLTYLLTALPLALLGGAGALFWTAVWLGVTWLAMWFVGSAGLWCSVRARTSWRSLLGTLGISYVGGSCIMGILWCMLMPFMFILTMLVVAVLNTYGVITGNPTAASFRAIIIAQQVGVCLALTGMFILWAWLFMRAAEYRVSVLERIKHWKDEPLYMRPRRRRPPPRYSRPRRRQREDWDDEDW
jgi:ABC-type transport system involved in multi-copper enzyme maturation permease subunit